MQSADEYADFLRSDGLPVECYGPWVIVGHVVQVQGWKLHLSSTPRQLPTLLKTVLPILKTGSTAFKAVRSLAALHQLNEGALGATQIGKTITVYPAEEDCAELADALVAATSGFTGPVVVTDLPLGNIVYARYGSFSPRFQRDRIGQVTPVIYSPDGRLMQDKYTAPFAPPDGVSNPFLNRMPVSSFQPDPLLGPGYKCIDILKADPKGSVFLAIDLRSGDSIKLVALKEGRAHCLEDESGRDIRSRLRAEERAHKDLSRILATPTADSYFEVSGNGYLPIEYVGGGEILEGLEGRFAEFTPDDKRRVIRAIAAVARELTALHAAGWVHRDLSPANVRIDLDGRVWLLDLEMAYRSGSDEDPYFQGTPGFVSPQQIEEEEPDKSDDVFSLGCILIRALTGLDPRLVLFANPTDRAKQLQHLSGAPNSLTAVTAACVSECRAERPSASQVAEALDGYHTNPTEASAALIDSDPHCDHRALTDIARGMLSTVRVDSNGLWLSRVISEGPDANRESASEYRLFRSANRGVAGAVYTLSRLMRSGYRPLGISERIEAGVDWLLAHHPTSDDQLPGLHFGEAGVAVAIQEAIEARAISKGGWFVGYITSALTGPLDWPDLTHGAAGQGLAALMCRDQLGAERAMQLASRCADYLIENQEADGGWVLPEGVVGMTGGRYTGFAHGVAGIAYFLTELAAQGGPAGCAEAARHATEWVRARARMKGSAIEWPVADSDDDVWHWWCHGAPGIALLFLRRFEHSQSLHDSRIAQAALRALPPRLRASNLSQCHGLSGIGEIYLEAARVLNDPFWRARADEVAVTLKSLVRRNHHGAAWLVEDMFVPSADLMVGMGGVAHFLLRASRPELSLSPPLLPGPVLIRG